jgi:hypothetical protein
VHDRQSCVRSTTLSAASGPSFELFVARARPLPLPVASLDDRRSTALGASMKSSGARRERSDHHQSAHR